MQAKHSCIVLTLGSGLLGSCEGSPLGVRELSVQQTAAARAARVGTGLVLSHGLISNRSLEKTSQHVLRKRECRP